MLDNMEQHFDRADPEAVAMWKWHLMEEFEHRTVCYDVYHHFHGGYFLRVYGFFYQAWHLGGMIKKVRNFLLAQYRQNMSGEELAESERRLKLATGAMGKGMLGKLIKVLSPRYSPHGYEEPRNYRAFMDKIEQRVI